MNTKLRWNEGMKFTAESGDNRFVMDAKTPIGRGEAMTPKEALLASMAGRGEVLGQAEALVRTQEG